MPLAPEQGDPKEAKFVEVELAEISNPKRLPLKFELHFESPGGVKGLLGTFGPFPADNPGTFLVATQGKLQGGGRLVLVLVPIDTPVAGYEVWVTVKRVSLRAR